MQSYATEMHEVKNESGSMITANVFCATPENHYNIRNHNAISVYQSKHLISRNKNMEYCSHNIKT